MLVSLTIKHCMTSAAEQHRDYHDARRRTQAVSLLQFSPVLFKVSTTTEKWNTKGKSNLLEFNMRVSTILPTIYSIVLSSQVDIKAKQG